MTVGIMKKLNITGTIILIIGVVIPSGSIAAPDDEVTIRVMEMHEKSTSSVMNRIKLPETASDKITEEATYRKRLTERNGQTPDDKDWGRIHDQERIYDKEQGQQRELDLVQDQIRDAGPDPGNSKQTGNETGRELNNR